MQKCPIKGFQGTSLIDYPGRIASIIYTGGCNFRCRYCYNRALVDNTHLPDLDTAEILGELRARRGFIEGVVVTGGEPTIHPGVIELLRAIKRIGLRVKLDTNGAQYAILEWIIEEELADYIAMDYKAPLEKLERVAGVAGAEERVRASAQLLIKRAKHYEFRTTVHPALLDPFDIDEIAGEIAGAAAYYLQQYHAIDSLDTALMEAAPYPADFFHAAAARLAHRFPTFALRNLPESAQPRAVPGAPAPEQQIIFTQTE
jgi:pyruvate formate lyase activating enzyme